MNKDLETAAINFVFRIKGTVSKGKAMSKKKLNGINERIGGVLPDWYIELFTKYPISEAYIFYPIYELSGENDEYYPIQIALPKSIYEETELYYPGVVIKDSGFFCFLNDLTGSGDPGFTTNRKGDNPPVFLVYHDVSDMGEEIEKAGMKKIAESLSEFFNKTKPFRNKMVVT